ncbi:MAG TPA: hypothetical protein VFU28_21675 [Vicinamibacterales bacterium]|nr:hypothetical protein [Vicinamibacterales bacterium]
MEIIKSRENRLAWFVALAADAIQIAVLPLFAAGALSPADTLVDLATAVILSKLVGWHWAFVPTMLAELVPGLDLFPTWTAAVFYVTWRSAPSPQPDIHSANVVQGRFLNS